MEASERHLSTARKLFQHALDVGAAEGSEEEEEREREQHRGVREAGQVSGWNT